MSHQLLSVSMACLLAAGAAAPATSPAPAPREPQYPLKSARLIVSDEQVTRARRNIQSYPQAKKLADAIIAQADEWAAWEDAELIALVPGGDVPRAFDVGTAGCPACGHELYEKFGNYGWIVDPKLPFKVSCPVDGSVYPTNDFAAYYRSGFTRKTGWDTKYVDEGRGWVGPTGEKYWFVAYANHWLLHGKLIPGVRALGRAYLLTGERRYAHKAAVLLYRFAQVYPGMDHESQSRYGEMMRARGQKYPGKIVNHIWETAVASALAEAYDAVWETIDGDDELQRATGRSGEQIRAFMEANLLEEAIDALFQGKIRGNFGMHQSALVYLGLARQSEPRDRWFDGLLDDGSPSPLHQGLRFALYNLIYRDGIPYETAPGYNRLWVNKIAGYGELLAMTGRDVFALPRTQRIFDGVLELICARAWTPSVGDSGSVWGALIGADAATFQTAYRRYRDERYRRFLASFAAVGDAGFTSYESLFHPPIDPVEGELPPQKSRLLDGYGMAILNNAADSIALALYYGHRGGHGHFDRLNVELFAHGRPMLPDLGYPDAMNEFVPGIFTWSKNTIAHNTVTVDASRQAGNAPGRVELFADGTFARVVDVSGEGTYPQCPVYRRCVVMVDLDEQRSYFVDFYTVAGGRQHDYSLHGPPGGFRMIGGEWSPAAPGTLAGPDVPIGHIYDNPAMAADGYAGGYGGYAGSGFQHLFNVRTLTDAGAEWVAEYAHEKDPAARVQLRILPRPDQQVLLAEARVSPTKHPELLRYLIARARGENLSSRFVSVIEPFQGQAMIRAARQPHAPGAEAVAIQRGDGQIDLIVYNPAGAEAQVAAFSLKTGAKVAVVTLDAAGEPVRVFFAGGSELNIGGRRFQASPGVSGTVRAVEAARSRIRVRLAGDPRGRQDEALPGGRVAHFVNALRRTAHPIALAERDGDDLLLTARDDLLVGRARIEQVEPAALVTRTALPLAACYGGVSIADDAMTFAARVRRVEGGRIELCEPLPDAHPFKAGDDLWLVNVGPDDELWIDPVFSWQQTGRADAPEAGADQ